LTRSSVWRMILKTSLSTWSNVILRQLRRMLKRPSLTTTSSKSKNITLDPSRLSSKLELMPSTSYAAPSTKKYSIGASSSKWEDNKENMRKIGLPLDTFPRPSSIPSRNTRTTRGKRVKGTKGMKDMKGTSTQKEIRANTTITENIVNIMSIITSITTIITKLKKLLRSRQSRFKSPSLKKRNLNRVSPLRSLK
jgi:hypothetical protein